jgi:glycosyltransferase involved in cell wall biosynthesis
MNIALIVPGGVDRSAEFRVIPAVLALVRRLASQHQVHVFALRQEPRPCRWTMFGATVENLGEPWPTLRCVLAIRRQHAIAPFDVVHCLWAGDPGFAGALAARWLGLPVLIHLAGGELVAIGDIAYGNRLGRVRPRIDDWTLKHASCVTAASGPIIDMAAALGIAARRVPLGVDLDEWPALAPRRRAAPGVARLIHVASLNPVKDQPTLLRALQLLAAAGREFHVDIVGEDVSRGEVPALAARLGIDARLSFHGFLTQRQLRPLMEAAHLNLVSSRHEAGPLVALEAAVAGVPTVGTAVGHLVEWAPHAASIVPVRDPAQLCAAIMRLVDDEDLRLSQATAAQQLACRENADHTARRFLELYRELRPR